MTLSLRVKIVVSLHALLAYLKEKTPFERAVAHIYFAFFQLTERDSQSESEREVTECVSFLTTNRIFSVDIVVASGREAAPRTGSTSYNRSFVDKALVAECRVALVVARAQSTVDGLLLRTTVSVRVREGQGDRRRGWATLTF